MANKCKKSHFGNCGPDTEGEYCLFHKPNKSEEESRIFYEELGIKTAGGGQIIEEKIDWSGFVFPEFSRPLFTLFMESTFEKGINCEKAHFKIRAVFEHAMFEDYAKFKDVTFEKPVNFKNAEFKSGADFRSAIFNEKANFRLAEFFSANFRKAEFEGKADFWKTSYEKAADFNRAKFRFDGGKVNFSESTFSENVDFSSGVEFRGGVAFDMVEFRNEVNFMYTYFKGNSSFVKAIFTSIAEFSHSTFEKDAIFSAAEFNNEATFRDVKFSIEKENQTPNKSRLTNFDRTIFDYAPNFSETKFGGELSFRLTHFSRGVDMVKHPQDLKKGRFALDQARQEVFRIQKNVYENEGRKNASDEMFLKEMRARRAHINLILRFLEWLVADFTCQYGTNWKRVLGISGSIIFMSSFFYWLGSISSLIGQIAPKGSLSNLSFSGFGNSLYYSTVTFTTLGFGDMHPIGAWMKFVSSLESIVGAVLMALLVAVFARKWMR